MQTEIKAARRVNAIGMINLGQRRIWFTQNDGGTGAGSSAGTGNTEHMIPKSRFDEVNQRAQDAEAALEKLRSETAEAERTRLAKQGEYQTLAQTAQQEVEALRPYKVEAETYRSDYTEMSKQLIAQVPEDMRDIIPPLAPRELFLWLNANVARLQKRLAPNIDAGAGGSGGTVQAKLTDEEKAFAKQTGISDEDFLKAKQKVAKS